jgi:hypothetical protein
MCGVRQLAQRKRNPETGDIPHIPHTLVPDPDGLN